MRWTKILGVALLVIGLIAIVLRTYGYTSERQTLETEAIEIQVEEREALPVPLWIGVALAVAGGALLLFPRRSQK
ncbi:MAG: hypothetical protein ACREMK_13385 [Gemmatimonadota bacterium]